MMHQRKPQLIARAGLGYARYLMGKKPRLRYVDVIVDYGCNLSCEHCSCASLRDPSRKIMTPKDWGVVARQAEALGAVIFGVQGGEPLIYPKLGEVIQEISAARNFISLKSNGTVVSSELFRKLKRWKVDSVTIGFGPVPNEFEFDDYDLITRRLNDAFATSLNAVRLLAEVGIKPMMSVVISRRNIRSKVFLGMINLAKEYHCVLNLALAVPVGSWERDYDLMLTSQDREELRILMRQNPHVRTDFESNWCINGCGALKEKVYISPYGDVLPCPFIHISFGNVLREPLRAIWERGIKTKALGEYAPVCLAAEDRVFLSYLETAKRKNIQLPIRCDDPEVADILATTYRQRTASAN